MPASSKETGIDIHRAADRGTFRDVCKYVEIGGDVNARDKSQWTPLHRCARKGHTDACKFLLQHGADVTLKTMELWTPLHCACVGGHPAVVKELVSATPSPALQSKTRLGQTPLYLAAYWGHLHSVRELLAAGADTTLKDAHGRAPGEDFHETVATPLKVAVGAALRAANPIVTSSPSVSQDEVGELKRRVKKLEDAVAALQAERFGANAALLGPAPTDPLSNPMAALAPPATVSAVTAAGLVAPAPANGGGLLTGAEDAKRRKV
ncbi:unnamed protein product [Ectocarpus sp. 4 AP-2014]